MNRFVSTVMMAMALASGLAACGGAPPKSRAAESAPVPPSAAAQPGYPAAGAATGAPPSTSEDTSNERDRAAPKAAAAPNTAPSPGVAGAAPRARSEVEAAHRELDLAGSDCARACRALGSMERATARLCTLDEASCEDVRVRLIRARERVRTTCGGCPGGPSVNPDAPIPSR